MRSAIGRWWLPTLAVIMALVCARLGMWQLDRLDQRRAANERVREGQAAPPVEIGVALEGQLIYRGVHATGTYDTAGELSLYGRPLDGQPGDHVLTPLVLDDGTRVLVDRGWVPPGTGNDRSPPADAAAPAGQVEISGVLVPSEQGDAFADRDPSSRLIRAVNIDQMNEAGAGLASVYILLDTQAPPQSSGLPVPAPLPELDEGPHLSYSIQWFAFGLIALIGAVVLVRRRTRAQATGDQATHAPGPTANG